MQVIEAYSYLIECTTEASLSDSSADAGYVQRYEGVVRWVPSDEDEESEQVDVGSFMALHLRCADMSDNDVYDPITWADAEDSEMGNIASALYAKDGDWSEALRLLWPDIENFDLLVIRDLVLEEKHRGNGLSTRIVEKIIDVAGYACGIVALIPLPINTKGMLSEEVKSVSAKIAKRFEGMGFRRVQDTVVWAMSLEHERDLSTN